MVSIVVAAYNVEKYIEKCLLSCINQTYNNIEVIVVDDGSTDSTASIINRVAEKYDVVRSYRKSNGGVSTARNKGIQLSRGDYIMFVDGDDYLDCHIVERLRSHIDVETEIATCCCNCFCEDFIQEDCFFEKTFTAKNWEEKEPLYLQLLIPTMLQPVRENAYTAIGVPWGKLYSRDLLQRNNLWFNTNLLRLQDNVFNMWVFYYARKVTYVNEPLYFYRIDHITSIKKGYAPDIYYGVLKERRRFIKENRSLPFSYQLRKCFDISTIGFLTGSIQNIVTNNNYFSSVKKCRILCQSKIYAHVIKHVKLATISKYRAIICILARLRMYHILTIVGLVRSKI